MKAKQRVDGTLREKLATILLVGMTLLMPGINQGMEGDLQIRQTQTSTSIEKIPILEDLYVHSIPSEIRTKILLEANYDLQDMENLMLGALPEKVAEKFISKEEDRKYKLWAFRLGERLKGKNPKSIFYKIQQDFGNWAWKKRESVEGQLGMPKAGSPEEQPYLFKKGWFDASEDPEDPIPYKIDHDFYLSDFITQEVWVEVMGENPSSYPNKMPCPEDFRIIAKLRPGKDGTLVKKEIPYCEGWAVTNITLYDAQKFVHIMNMGSPAHVKYDIPTEWQFDLAARGGIVSETEDGIINTGRFGSLEVTDLETFQTKIPWTGTGSWDQGPGRTKQKSPFPRPLGPHDLIGHLRPWTKSLNVQGGLAARRTPYTTTETKSWGLDWNLEKRGGSASYRVIRGADWGVCEDYLRVCHDYFYLPLNSGNWLGLRLLRTNHKPFNPESSNP